MKTPLMIGLGGLNLALMLAAAFSSHAAYAQAQGQNMEPIKKVGAICPFNWREGNGKQGVPGMCYPMTQSAPAAYVRPNGQECVAGYYPSGGYCSTNKPNYVSAETTRAQPTSLTKPAPNARCPVGWASTRDLQTCYTTIENGSVARLSNGKPCGAGEIAEWGLWCTANYQGIAKERALNAGAKDFNEVYAWTLRNRGDTKTVGDALSPAAAAWFDSQSGSTAAAAKSTASVDASSSEAAKPECTTDSATGAAIGGAVGGKAGARVGSALGGMAKKKKKSGC